MFALWVKPQRELQKMVHITHSNLKVCNKMNTCNLIETLFNFCALHFIFLSYIKLISREQTLIKDNQGDYLSKGGPQETTTMQNLSI